MAHFLNQLNDGDLLLLVLFGAIVGFCIAGMVAILIADVVRMRWCKHTHEVVNSQGRRICLKCRKDLGRPVDPTSIPPKHINCRCTVSPLFQWDSIPDARTDPRIRAAASDHKEPSA